MITIVDTHPLLWYLEDDPQIGSQARTILEDPQSRLIVPTIVLAEILWALRKKNADPSDWQKILSFIRSDSRFSIYPLTTDVVVETDDSLEMHDAMICATAILLSRRFGEPAQLLTKDRDIIASALVPTFW